MPAAHSDPARIVAASYFCGERHHDAGPYAFDLAHGRIVAITPLEDAAGAPATAADEAVAFLMPTLVEAHGHLFLDGTAPGPAPRAGGAGRDFDAMAAVAAENVRRARARGIGLVRDAGDRYGINHAMRGRSRGEPHACPVIRSPGTAIRRTGCYGKFMALEVDTAQEAVDAVDRIATTADDVKIILTGIVDFQRLAVTEAPQFDAPTLRQMVDCAHRHGRPVFAHCSGLAGIELAIAAGVDSIEHGYFMSTDALRAMADRAIAWVPTLAPVHFQWAHPAIAGWTAPAVANIRRILDAHLEHIALADRLGVRLVAGSDAGSPGVAHGRGLVEELLLLRAAGLPMTRVLAAATSVPRRHWGCAWPVLRPGCPAEFLALAASPFDAPEALQGPSRLHAGAATAPP